MAIEVAGAVIVPRMRNTLVGVSKQTQIVSFHFREQEQVQHNIPLTFEDVFNNHWVRNIDDRWFKMIIDIRSPILSLLLC